MTKFCFLLFTVLLPGIVNAQFTYTVNFDHTVTIQGYNGPVGAVEIPSSINSWPVVNIQPLSFGWTNATSIAIPDSVTNIDAVAFKNCPTATNITVGAGVVSIGGMAFGFCDSLLAITVDANNPAFSSVGGILFDKDQRNLIQCPRKMTGNYTIPDSVTNILEDAFFACAGLTNVTIGTGVISIGSAAFYTCAGLTNVTIGTGVISIGSQAFGYCTGLTNVTIPDGVSNLSEYAFGYCRGLTNVSIGKGISTIKDSTFVGCYSLMNISIPTNISSLEDGAFRGCSSLTNVIMQANLKNIDSYCFSGCTNLQAISIPPSVTNIGGLAFNYCTRLSNVSIPGSVISIGPEVFVWCSGLTNVTIGDGVVAIGRNAFAHCPQLASVTIPQSVTTIGTSPFYSSSGLMEISVDANNLFYSSVDGVLFNKNQTILLEWPHGRPGSYTVPNSVTNIVPYAFEYSIPLTDVTMDVNLANVGYGAFFACSNLTALYFKGDAPAGSGAFGFARPTTAVAYYLLGTSGWSPTWDIIPTALWHLPNPMMLTFEPNFGVRTNNFGFTVSWATNIPVVVEACTNLADPVWSPVATLTLTSGSAYFSDPQTTNYPNRFYRLRSP
jgi:hypothetical protein